MGIAAALAAAVSACGGGEGAGERPPPDPAPPPERAGENAPVVHVVQRRGAEAERTGARYIEGATPFLRIARRGEKPVVARLLHDAPEEGQLLLERLEPGRYTVASHVRPGSGSGRPPRLDPPADRCSRDVRIRAAESVTLTISRVPGEACSIAVDRAGFRDLVGSSVAAARAKARRRGFEMRVVRRDGRSLPITRDLSFARVNVAVRDGVVTAVDGIY